MSWPVATVDAAAVACRADLAVRFLYTNQPGVM